MSNTLNWVFLCLLGLIWGGSFMGVAFALEGFGPMSVAALRILLAAILLGAFTLIKGDGYPSPSTPIGRRVWLHCIGMGLLSNAIPFTLLSWGQQYVTSGFAGITMAVVPLLVLPLAHFLVPNETLNLRKAIGFCVGFAGVVILIGPASLFGDSEVNLIPRLACVTASLCYACGSITTRLAPKTSLISFSAAALLVAACVLTPIALYYEGIPSTPNQNAILGVLYLGLIPTALATILLVRVITTAGPSFMSLVNYQVPIWAVVLGMVFLAEPLPSQFAGALVLILLGLAISQARALRFRP